MSKDTKPNKQSLIHDVTSSVLVEKAKDIIAQIYELTLDKSSFDLDRATDAMYSFIYDIK